MTSERIAADERRREDNARLGLERHNHPRYVHGEGAVATPSRALVRGGISVRMSMQYDSAAGTCGRLSDRSPCRAGGGLLRPTLQGRLH